MMRIGNVRKNGLVALFATAATLAVAVGCSKSSSGGGTPTPSACATVSPLLSDIETQIFTPTCAVGGDSCHGTAQNTGDNLDLSSASQVLVTGSNVTAVETFNQNSVKIIAPGSHAESYMWLKITDAAGISLSPMPLTGGSLNTCQIDAIAAWIDAGAQND